MHSLYIQWRKIKIIAVVMPNKSFYSRVLNAPSSVSVNNKGEVIIQVLAKPGAKQNNITDVSEESIGIQIAAPPKDGEANAELLSFLRSVLQLRKSELLLVRGSKSRLKSVKVSSEKYKDANELRAVLARQVIGSS